MPRAPFHLEACCEPGLVAGPQRGPAARPSASAWVPRWVGLVLSLLLAPTACRHGPEPIKEPALSRPTGRELFRRARFKELTESDPDGMARLARLMRSSNVSEAEDYDDFVARASYRRGEVEAARQAMAGLSETNKTRRILEALLAHADPKVPLRESECERRLVDLPLNAKALDRGYVVIDVEVDGAPLRVLWDTGATDNVLSPRAADTLQLPLADVQLTLRRRDDALVVRLSASATRELALGPWRLRNVPWLVSDLDTVEGLKRDLDLVDGFLSPQLLLPNGCFAVDRVKSVLSLGFGAKACVQLMAGASRTTPLFSWDGEVYAAARVWRSPELAVRLETGSPITFLRAHAARWLPTGLIAGVEGAPDEEIARALSREVPIELAGRQTMVSAIDLDPSRQEVSHDDIATLGNDVLLQGRGIAIDFTRMEVGTLELEEPGAPGGARSIDLAPPPPTEEGDGEPGSRPR